MIEQICSSVPLLNEFANCSQAYYPSCARSETTRSRTMQNLLWTSPLKHLDMYHSAAASSKTHQFLQYLFHLKTNLKLHTCSTLLVRSVMFSVVRFNMSAFARTVISKRLSRLLISCSKTFCRSQTEARVRVGTEW